MYYDDTLATMTKASVSHLYPPALSTAWPGGTHIELESEVKISLTESWIVASQLTPPYGAHGAESSKRAGRAQARKADSSSAWSQSTEARGHDKRRPCGLCIVLS